MKHVWANYKIEIGIDGLTCSQCSRSVEIQLKRLPFLSNINMELEQAIATSIIKQEQSFSVQKIVLAVEKAGFSVGYIKLCSDSVDEMDKNNVLVIGNSGLWIPEWKSLAANHCYIVTKANLKPTKNQYKGYNAKMLIYETEVTK